MTSGVTATTRPYEDRLRRLAEEWYVLLEERAQPLRVVGVEYAIRFLQGELGLQRLKNERLRKVSAKCIDGKNEWRLEEPAELFIVRKLLAKRVVNGYSEEVGSLVISAREIFSRGDYVCAIVQHIEKRVCSADAFDEDLVRLIRELAICFVLRGFEPDDTKELLSKIFFEKTFEHEGILYTSFPYSVVRSSLPVSDLATQQQRDEYNSALSNRLSSLTLADRFRAIVTSFQREPEELIYVYPLRGIKGRRSHMIGAVEIYPPHVLPKQTTAGITETFGRSEPDVLNAAITLNGLGNEENRSEAARRIQECLDLLEFFIPTNVPIEIDLDTCQVFRQNGAIYGSYNRKSRTNPTLEHQYMACEIDEIADRHSVYAEIVETADALGGRQDDNETEARVEEALRAISKANHGDVLEDRLVNYWIAIEALMGRVNDKERVAVGLLPALSVNELRWGVALRLWHHLRYAHMNRHQDRFASVFANVSGDLLSRSSVPVTPFSQTDLRDFVGTLSEWLSVVPADTDVYRRIAYVSRFYSDNRIAKKELHHLKEAAHDDVVFIYQVRNRVVHHAFVDSPATNYLTERAGFFARLFISAVLRNRDLSPAQVVANETVRADRFLGHLELDPSFSLLSDEL